MNKLDHNSTRRRVITFGLSLMFMAPSVVHALGFISNVGGDDTLDYLNKSYSYYWGAGGTNPLLLSLA